MQGANKRLVRNSESTLTTTSRSRTAAVPRERIAKHLSERTLTAGGVNVGSEARGGSAGDPWSPMTS